LAFKRIARRMMTALIGSEAKHSKGWRWAGDWTRPIFDSVCQVEYNFAQKVASALGLELGIRGEKPQALEGWCDST
jgi:hypothetical protein